MIKCDKCPFEGVHPSDVKKHMTVHTESKCYGAVSAEKCKLKDHKFQHTGEKPHKCNVCPLEFAHKASLNVHNRKHTGERPFTCTVCDKKFQRSVELKRHKIKHTKGQDFRCTTCDKKFRWKNSLMKHIRYTHLEERPFQCEICQKSFVNKDYLKIHEKIHVGGTTYKKGDFLCDLCDKSLSSLMSFTEHSYIHTGEKPFQCTICFKRFRQNSRWYEHELDHKRIEEKPWFSCNVCMRQFKFKQSLHRHVCIKQLEEKLSVKYERGKIRQEEKVKQRTFKKDLIHSQKRQLENNWNEEDMDNNIFEWVLNKTGAVKDEKDVIIKPEGSSELSQRNIVCLVCPYRKDFGHIDFWDHVRSNHAEQSCICLLCKSIHQNIPGLKQHIKRSHKEKWKLICKRSRDRRTSSKRNKDNLDGQDIKNEPEITHSSESDKQKHIDIEMKSEIMFLTCSFCGNLSGSKNYLQNHICSSSDLFCKECGFLAGSTQTWKRHIEYSH